MSGRSIVLARELVGRVDVDHGVVVVNWLVSQVGGCARLDRDAPVVEHVHLGALEQLEGE
jgi:hypothetical protein